MTDADAEAGPAFVLGFDGVPWNLVRDWAGNGDLPAFARLIEEGAAGPLESTIPATTPVAWPSIASGVRPDKHGSYWFRRLRDDYTHEVRTSDRIEGPMLWDVLSPAAVANVPMTFPAREIDGVVVSGMMTPESREGFTSPPSLAEDIESRVPGYEVGLKWGEYDDRMEEFYEDLDSLIENCQELLRLLVEREDWRLCFFVHTFPDRLQHLVWEEDVLKRYYRRMDEVLEEVMTHVDARGGTLYVVSDHGFGPIEKTVSLNAALAEAGLLDRRSDGGVRGGLSRLGVTKDTVLDVLAHAGIDQTTLVRHLPESVTNRVASQIPGSHALYDVDYGATTAFGYGYGLVYVNDRERFARGRVEPDSVEAAKRTTETALSEVRDPETGERVLDVHDGAELFPTDPAGPDLVVTPREGYDVVSTLGDAVIDDSPTMRASHRPEGTFLAWGPDVAAGAEPVDATVFDVAPTLLHAAGVPVPDRVDGRVLSEIFRDGSRPDEERVRTRSYASEDSHGTELDGDDFDDVTDRLRGLGYID